MMKWGVNTREVHSVERGQRSKSRATDRLARNRKRRLEVSRREGKTEKWGKEKIGL